MRAVILLICICCVASNTAPNNCSGIIFNGQYYEREILLEGVDVLGGFSINRNYNILFFGYATENSDINLGYLNLETKEFRQIEEIKGGYASVVDQVDLVNYIAGENGIYTFDAPTKKVYFYGAGGTNIWSLYYWDKLYYSDFPNNDIYRFNSGNSQLVTELKGNFIKFAVGTSDGTYFVNSTGLFRANSDFKVTDLYSTDDAYRFICKDSAGNVYVGRREFENEHTINVDVYKINKKEKNIEKISFIEESVTSMVFDRYDNIIIDEADKIVRLTVNKNQMECLRKN